MRCSDDLAAVGPVAMLDEVEALPRAEGEAPSSTGIATDAPVSIVRIWAGMSSAPPRRGRSRRSRGARRSSAVIRSARTSGSAFSWIVSEAEVWRQKTVSSPSRMPRSRDPAARPRP